MAGKKVPCIEDALNNFKDVMRRASIQNYGYVNRIMLSKNPKNQSILTIPEPELWTKILNDPDLKDHIKESDATGDDVMLFSYGEDLATGWIEIDPNIIFNGVIFKLTIDGFEYDFPINKNLIPLKLKKAEANNIAYKVFTSPNTLAIKKRFEFPVDGGSFTIMRLLQIL